MGLSVNGQLGVQALFLPGPTLAELVRRLAWGCGAPAVLLTMRPVRGQSLAPWRGILNIPFLPHHLPLRLIISPK